MYVFTIKQLLIKISFEMSYQSIICGAIVNSECTQFSIQIPFNKTIFKYIVEHITYMRIRNFLQIHNLLV